MKRSFFSLNRLVLLYATYVNTLTWEDNFIVSWWVDGCQHWIEKQTLSSCLQNFQRAVFYLDSEHSIYVIGKQFFIWHNIIYHYVSSFSFNCLTTSAISKGILIIFRNCKPIRQEHRTAVTWQDYLCRIVLQCFFLWYSWVWKKKLFTNLFI